MAALCLLAGSASAGSPTATAGIAGTEGPRTRAEAATAWRDAGLQPRSARGLDLVYVRPGADLSAYRRLWLRPVQVDFQRDWARAQERATGTRVRPDDLQEIRDDLSTAVRREVAEELVRRGYAFADGPGEGVLELEVRITELYLNAGDVPGADPIRSYTMNFGHMNLVAELRDSVSGEPALRILDRTLGRDHGFLRYTTQAENTRDVAIAAQAWTGAVARQLAVAGVAPGR